MRLLTAHKILVVAWLVLCVAMIAWGARHARDGRGGWIPLALGAAALPAGAVYLRHLYRRPPLK